MVVILSLSLGAFVLPFCRPNVVVVDVVVLVQLLSLHLGTIAPGTTATTTTTMATSAEQRASCDKNPTSNAGRMPLG